MSKEHELSEPTKALLRAANAEQPEALSPEVRSRIKLAVVAAAAAGVGATASAKASPLHVPWLGLSKGAMVAVTTSGVVMSAALASWALHHSEAPEASPAPASVVQPAQVPQGSEADPPVHRDAPVASRVLEPVRRVSPVATKESAMPELLQERSVSVEEPAWSLQDEARVLRQVQEFLRDQRPAEALRLLDEHRNVRPFLQLRQEAQAQRVFALCALQFNAEALAAAEMFLASEPAGPLAERVRHACFLKNEDDQK